jgi:hypothetical protein
MRRKRHRETRVWHDPLVTATGQRRAAEAVDTIEEGEDVEPVSGRRARRRGGGVKRDGVKIIAGPLNHTDPKELERQRLLSRVLAAEGRPSISRAVEEFLGAGFALPRAQDVCLQLLEHKDEERVTEAIGSLTELLAEEAPQRRAVLESRLRRIEEYADEPRTQEAAGHLRRFLHTRYAETL